MTDDIRSASGRFVLRLDPDLHARLRAEAEEVGVSLNELCVRRLARPDMVIGREVVARAAAAFGSSLRAVVAFGSWARGSAAAESDVDVLMVVAESVRLERSLYRRWDEEPIRLDARRVEAHIAHLPGPDARPTGLWCELAMEGLVLHDRDLATSRYLASVRARIASGDVTRRVAHGQPYWAGAA